MCFGEYRRLAVSRKLRGVIHRCGALRRADHLPTKAPDIRNDNRKKSEYLSAAGEIQGIEIKCEDGILEITLPCLIPKRRQRRSTEFLIDPLYFTLSSYVCNHKVPHFKDCVVCFAHVYDESMPSTRIRDYDNLELKQLLDVVSSFVMLDDSGLLCDAYNTTEWGTADCTRMTIMPKERFPKWLEERKNVIKNISDF